MVTDPPIENLLKRVNSKYTLVGAAAKRAREINEEHRHDPDAIKIKPVSMALAEISQGTIRAERIKETGA
jgi:DNA-directed RNA polymerase subunit omega